MLQCFRVAVLSITNVYNRDIETFNKVRRTFTNTKIRWKKRNLEKSLTKRGISTHKNKSIIYGVGTTQRTDRIRKIYMYVCMYEATCVDMKETCLLFL